MNQAIFIFSPFIFSPFARNDLCNQSNRLARIDPSLFSVSYQVERKNSIRSRTRRLKMTPSSEFRFILSSIIIGTNVASIRFKCIQQILPLVKGIAASNRGRYFDSRRDFCNLFFHGLSVRRRLFPSLSPCFTMLPAQWMEISEAIYHKFNKTQGAPISNQLSRKR